MSVGMKIGALGAAPHFLRTHNILQNMYLNHNIAAY